MSHIVIKIPCACCMFHLSC
uniref:Uncharacterized protein n=1 Tax=Anguilla anguilla TaxID=7936 RepID=A0A0E9U8J2_ANGAN